MILDSIRNYFISLTNGGYNTFKYKKPYLGQMFISVDGDGNRFYTNYVKDREITDSLTIWKKLYK